MKKIACLIAFMFSVSLYAADAAVTAAKPVSGTPAAGVSLNLADGLLNASKGSVGINGFSFRFLDANKKGYEIPFSCLLTNSDALNNTTRNLSTNLSISAGYRFINPIFMNEFIRVNILPGVSGGYSGSWSQSNDDLYPVNNRITAQHTFNLGISAGLEVEVPIGKLFTLPADTICLASGISVTVSGSFISNYQNGSYNTSSMSFGISTGSFGTGINSLGVRYYF